MEICVGEIYLEDMFSNCNENEYSANNNGENLKIMETKEFLGT